MSGNKRPFNGTNQPTNDDKRPKIGDRSTDLKREEAKRKARERLAQLKAKKAGTQSSSPTPLQTTSSEQSAPPPKARGLGLNIELHPLLSGKPTPQPTINPNLQKINKQGYTVNPYMDNLSQSRKKREFHFVEKGKYVKQAEDLRQAKREEEAQRQIFQERVKQGLEPDPILREERFKPEIPPVMEWWDEPFYENKDYDKPLNEVSIYVHHPVPINAPWEKHLPPQKPMYLTKKEMKRLRRNERFLKNQEIQEKIKQGLLPPPPPKIKLANLMNVLTSEAIKDPTAVEARVRKEIEERRQFHLKTNEERKLTKEQKDVKREIKHEKDLSKGYHTAVFLVKSLSHPSHKFKVETNAKQLKLTGTIIHIDDLFSLIISEGSEKSINFYKKLLTSRIKWQESTKVNGVSLDLSNNYCHLLWEGQVPELRFDRFSFFKAKDEQVALEFAEKFNMGGVFRDAVVYYRDH
ncbi:hypothetical protein WICPIJ_008168 [Wickerhamomyces pijperi]|uniref:Pre-mRNA-splicing factor 3 n=1 Tax=Wickerhamomyces pijperi TaxID=599730 RepID=A0A9P8TJ36_WICPI|nr:hypothetical protein WICPIJ_008168 [Wickerhamomyces pijperi]